MGEPLVFVLSTGRCGTQWLTEGLRRLYPRVTVTHEPLGVAYKPRRYFRRYAEVDALLRERPVRDHLHALVSAEHHYVETGWPALPALPWLAVHHPDRLRVVHLTRDPVRTAASLLSHNSYAGSWRRDKVVRWGVLGPQDRNVFQPHYKRLWPTLSAFEKCLFFWTEIHLFGEEFRGRFPEVPYLRVRSEALLGNDAEQMRRFLKFLELPDDPGWEEHAGRVVDAFHHRTDEGFDPTTIFRHDATCALAHRLGYSLERIDINALRSRYQGEPLKTRWRRLHSILATTRR